MPGHCAEFSSFFVNFYHFSAHFSNKNKGLHRIPTVFEREGGASPVPRMAERREVGVLRGTSH